VALAVGVAPSENIIKEPMRGFVAVVVVVRLATIMVFRHFNLLFFREEQEEKVGPGSIPQWVSLAQNPPSTSLQGLGAIVTLKRQ